MHEIHSRINTQPAFRRANPEGGFISVSDENLLPVHTRLTEDRSRYKRLQPTYLPRTVYATRHSNTNLRVTLVVSLQSLAKVSRMTASTTKIVTIFYT